MAVVLLWGTTALVLGQQKRFTVMGLGDSITEGGSNFLLISILYGSNCIRLVMTSISSGRVKASVVSAS